MRTVLPFLVLMLTAGNLAAEDSIVDDIIGSGIDFVEALDRPALTESMDKGRTILHFLAGFGNAGQIEVALENRIPVDPTDDEGRTPLFFAIWNGRPENVERLLDHGADPNHADSHGACPAVMLSGADAGVRLLILELLLEHGWDVNSQIGTNPPVLSYATMGGNRDMVSSLLSAGADPGLKDNTIGMLPVEYSVYIPRIYTDATELNADDYLLRNSIQDVFAAYGSYPRAVPGTIGIFGCFHASVYNIVNTLAPGRFNMADLNGEGYYSEAGDEFHGYQNILGMAGLESLVRDFELPILSIRHVHGTEALKAINDASGSKNPFFIIANFEDHLFCSEFWGIYAGFEDDPIMGPIAIADLTFSIMESLVFRESDITDAIILELDPREFD